MDPKIIFFFYLAAVICFGLAAFASAGGGRGFAARISLVPLGLALWLFPAMWTAGTSAF